MLAGVLGTSSASSRSLLTMHRVVLPIEEFQMKTPVGLRPKAFPVSGSKRIAQSSNSSRRTIRGLAMGFFCPRFCSLVQIN
jgi:hypothetical protein